MIRRIRSVLLPVRQQGVQSEGIPGARKRFNRCILHIGTEKTGTSTIQRFLSLNRGSLIDEGIVYPAATGRDGGSQWGFVACVEGKPWKSDVGAALGIGSEEEHNLYRNRLQEKLEDEFRAAPDANILIVSSEHFHSRLKSREAIARLLDFLSRWVAQFEVVLYLRRQDRVAVSLYSTKIKSGQQDPVLFPSKQREAPYYFSYDRIYDNWSSVFGEDAMRVRLFGRNEFHNGDLLEDFCLATGVEYKNKKIPEEENLALNRVGRQFMREVNRYLPAVVDGEGGGEREAFARLISTLACGNDPVASRAQARAFYRRFAEGNERLRKKLFPERPQLFDDDFSDYPEKFERQPPRYSEAVEMAIRIWRETRRGRE